MFYANSYRMKSYTIRKESQFAMTFGVVGVFLLIVLHAFLPFTMHTYDGNQHIKEIEPKKLTKKYNSTYPLKNPTFTPEGTRYRIGIVSDFDEHSKYTEKNNTWFSLYKKGYLTINKHKKSVYVEWDPDLIILQSNLSRIGRGMELSELIVFNGELLACDDKTGIIYEIQEDKVFPWITLTAGNGNTTKGFKCEWATIKNEHLYVGGFGKPSTSSEGKILNFDHQWVKVINPLGEVKHKDWRQIYGLLLRAGKTEFPGYMIHEAGVWSDLQQRWFFLPRRYSKYPYNDKKDQIRGTNIVLKANADFTDIRMTTIGHKTPTRGYSSFKFVPDTFDSVIVALKTEEIEGHFSTYVTAFDLDGEIWLTETEIEPYKFEGLEFI